ncbi:MAG: hypothetical protein IIA87_01305 [Nanoarchaeota archaeon]|nr:hypothetical protein [Nanoarchaeota archaeon]
MEYKSESLERKLDKPDWKQWLPVYGVYQGIRDARNGKPNFILEQTEQGVKLTRPAMFVVSATYHAVTTVAVSKGIIYGLYQLAEKLF